MIKSETVNQHLSVSASNKISDYIPNLWTIRKRGELFSYDVVFTFVRIEVPYKDGSVIAGNYI